MVQALSVNIYTAKVGKGYICINVKHGTEVLYAIDLFFLFFFSIVTKTAVFEWLDIYN